MRPKCTVLGPGGVSVCGNIALTPPGPHAAGTLLGPSAQKSFGDGVEVLVGAGAELVTGGDVPEPDRCAQRSGRSSDSPSSEHL